jgi:hypothetical protein
MCIIDLLGSLFSNWFGPYFISEFHSEWGREWGDISIAMDRASAVPIHLFVLKSTVGRGCSSRFLTNGLA